MAIPIKTLASGFSLPVYGLGLWQIGGRSDRDTRTDEHNVAAIQTAIDAGVTHIDTAESYGAGHAEELLGQAIAPYDRSTLIIASKVSAWNQGYDGVMQAFEASIKRLGTPYLDLYLLRRYPEPGIRIDETMRAMDELVRQGVVKNIGVCNMTPNRFDEAQRHSKHKLVCNEIHYNVQIREAEAKGVIAHAQANDVMVVAWRPLQKGFLPQTQLLEEIGEKYHKTPSQIAINWLVSQPNVVTIIKTLTPSHLHENLEAVTFNMDQVDIDRIRHQFPIQHARSDARPLDYEADIAP